VKMHGTSCFYVIEILKFEKKNAIVAIK